MKKLIAPVLLLSLCLTACDPEKFCKNTSIAITAIETSWNVAYAILKTKHDEGTLTDENWQKTQTIDVKYTAVMQTVKLALREYASTHDKSMEGKITQLVTDLQEILLTINNLIKALSK